MKNLVKQGEIGKKSQGSHKFPKKISMVLCVLLIAAMVFALPLVPMTRQPIQGGDSAYGRELEQKREKAKERRQEAPRDAANPAPEMQEPGGMSLLGESAKVQIIEEIPQTGDTENRLFWGILALFAIGWMVILLVMRLRHRKEKHIHGNTD
jgi:hypothetical protein